MTMTFAERADQLCDRLRDMEHHAEEGDQLFIAHIFLGFWGCIVALKVRVKRRLTETLQRFYKKRLRRKVSPRTIKQT